MGGKRKPGRMNKLPYVQMLAILLLVHTQPLDHSVSSCTPRSTPPVEQYVRGGLARDMKTPRKSYARVVNPEPKEGTRFDDRAYRDKPASSYLPSDHKNVDVDVNRDSSNKLNVPTTVNLLNESAISTEDVSSPVTSLTNDTQSLQNKTLTSEEQCACTTNTTLSTSSCKREWRTLFLLGSRILHAMRRASYQTNSCAGRRSQRQRTRQWAVDVAPNRRGQAKRNTLFLQYHKLDLHPGHVEPIHRQLVDLLLMSDIQSSGRKEGRSGVMLGNVLVFVALMAHLLQDQHGQKTAQKLLHHLLRRLASCTWTESFSSAVIVLNFLLPRSYLRVGGYPSHKTRQSKDSKENGYDNTPVSSPSNEPSVLGLFVRHTSLFVAPATSFLPSISSRDTHELDYLGYRLATLGLLPPACPLSRVRVADAGFHYNPKDNPNAVVCHKCGAALSWEHDSSNNSSPRLSPLAFHQATSPRCPFLTSLLDQFTQQPSVPAGQNSSGNMADQSGVPSQLPTPSGAAVLPAMSGNAVAASDSVDGRDLSEDCEGRPGKSTATYRPSTHTPPGSGYKLALPGSMSDQSSHLFPSPSPSPYLPTHFTTHPSRPTPHSHEVRHQLDLGQAVYPQFSTVSSRMVTYQNWPLEHTFPHQTLANLGFYYAGYSDCIRCFYCGVGLKSWEPSDSILKEHVRYRPQCGFLLATSSPSHVQALMESLNISQTPSVPTSSTASSNATTTTTSPTTATITSCNNSGRSSEGSNSGGSSSGGGNPPGTPVNGLSAEEDRQWVRQQLVDMGFSQDIIARAESSLYGAGTRVTLDDMLEFICN